ncbi:prohead protease/major capsid protein fusion protein [Microbaculum sp. FT89]|uniref:prohead protease/major capsid protein fusion protein n=1 Tax=Microbaculum sp. FT89 TaxID=3447298 RepID=UPI003F52E8C3
MMLQRAIDANQSDLMVRRAPAGGLSWDEETRTLDAVVSTFADVRRYGYIERLSREASNWDLTRVGSPAGVPFLAGHNMFNPGAKLGRVLAVTVGPQNVRAKIKLGDSQAAKQLVRDLVAGVGVAISFGYEVGEWERIPPANAGEREVRIARQIHLYEVSAVSVAADPGAHVRSKETSMDPDEIETATIEAPPPATPTREQETRTFGETERRALVQRYGLTNKFYNRHKDKDEGPFKEAILDHLAKRSEEHMTFPHVEVGGGGASFDNPEFRAAAMGEALYQRIAPRHSLSDPAREFARLTVPELARQCLAFGGHSTRGLSTAELVTRGLHTTSDFPLVLADTVNRTLRAAYDVPTSGVRMVARQTTARDFRKKTKLQLSGGPSLEKVNEHGEFKHGTFNESGESYKIDTFGKIFGITRQALVNDDLAAFDRVPREMGRAALAFENNFLADLVKANAAMSDGKALFHADHGNLAASGAVVSVTTLTVARQAMRKQTGLQGELISVPPKYLLVPAELETIGEQVLASIAAAKVDDVNPFSGRLELIVEPRFTDATRWYVVADPGVIDGLEYAYLEGDPGPQIDTEAGFDVDGVRFRVRLDFGGGFVDWRSWYSNPGE